MFLQAAGNAVKRASDNLVKAAQKAAFDAEDDQAVVVKSKMVGGIAQVSQRCRTQLEQIQAQRAALEHRQAILFFSTVFQQITQCLVFYYVGNSFRLGLVLV